MSVKETSGGSAPAGRGRGRYMLASAVVLGLLVAPLVAQAAHRTGQPVTTGTRLHVDRETGVIANNEGYSLRFSNKREGAGGGLVSGCRSAVGREACIYGDNLRDGQAFLFRVRRGSVGGRIEVLGANPKPFTTNATGVADGLNADRVDSREVACPPSTLEISGLCWDQAPRDAAPVTAAADVCQAAGGRLPTAMALRAVRAVEGIDLGQDLPVGADTDHLSDAVHVDDGTQQTMVVADDGGMRAVPVAEPHPFRCTFELVRPAS